MRVRWIGGELSVHGQLRENGAVYDFDERSARQLCAQGQAVAVVEPPAKPAPVSATGEKE